MPLRTPIFLLARSPESSLAASKSVKPGDAPRQPSGPFALEEQEDVGKSSCCSRCRGFAVADLALIFPVAVCDSL